MKLARLARGALAAAAVLGAAPLAGQGDDNRSFSSMWMVAPSDAPTGPRSVADGELVFRNRLVPPSLVRLRADAVDRRSRRVVAAAGTQLFGLLPGDARIYCVVGRNAPTSGSMLGLLVGERGNRQICLIDHDGDGTLDSHFRAGNRVPGLPSFTGRRPRDPDALTGAAYEELPPDQIDTDYYVGVKYEGTGGLANRTPVFSVVYGTDDSLGQLTDRVSPVRNSDPPLVTPLDAEFVVTAVRGDTIDIDVRRNVPPQSFHVVQTVTYR